MGVGNRIRELRESKKLKQADLARMIGVTPSAIGNYENGISHPKVDILYKLCKVLGCDANFLFQDVVNLNNNSILDANEMQLISNFRSLSEPCKTIVETTIKNLKELEQNGINNKLNRRVIYNKAHYSIPYYDMPVSAGTGEFLDSDYYELFDLTQPPPDGADFMLRVSGDSMEPTYVDGDKLFIKKQPALEKGEIGIFIIDGSAYVKEYDDDGLISHNKKYKKIKFTAFNNIQCCGKVIGIYTEKN